MSHLDLKGGFILKDETNTITEGVIWKQLLFFFIPILIGSFCQQLYNTADTIIVGRFVGKEALAAVGATGNLINLLVGFFIGLSSGSTVIISQYYGAQNEKGVSKAVHTSVWLSIISGFVLMVIGMVFAPQLLKMISVPKDIIELSTTYIRIYFIGMIPSLFYNMGSGILRAIGDSKRPLYFLIVATVCNIILDFVFVVGLSMGVVGVGIATVISQFLSAVLVLMILCRSEESYSLHLKQIHCSPSILNSIIKIGLPAGLQSVLYAVSNLVIQSSINAFGTDTIAAWAAYCKIDALFWMIMGSFGVAITTFVGQNYGAAKYDRVKRSVGVCTAMGITSAVLLSVVLIAFGNTIYSLFTNDPSVIRIGLAILYDLAPFYFTYVCVEVLSGAIRGTGEATFPMIITSVGICGLRLVWIFLMSPQSLRGVLACYPITWTVTSILFILYYFKGRWFKPVH